MKTYPTALFAVVLALLTIGATAQETIPLKVTMKNCGETLALYRFDGVQFKPFLQSQGRENIYTFHVPATGHHFYYLGREGRNFTPIILGGEKGVSIEGDCATSQPTVNIVNSPINAGYLQLKNDMTQLTSRAQQAAMSWQQSLTNETARQKVEDEMLVIDRDRANLLDSLREANPFLARIAALNTYLSFPNHGGKHPNEITYFGKEYFKHVDWSDPGYAQLPWVFEAFKNYTTTLGSVNLPAEQVQQYVQAAVGAIPATSTARKYALSGALAALQQRPNSAFIPIAEQFLQAYADEDAAAAANLREQVDRMRSFAVGGEAPDFSGETPDGGTLSLKSLRGKIVLIDFWASWCGPCRRENPNVVRLYEQYHPKGFEILGVSLDNSKDRWLQAIEADGLTWPHVSDLKGWESEFAALYSVRSIPHTVLVDAEGKIIARGLRGGALEEKLAELFSDSDSGD